MTRNPIGKLVAFVVALIAAIVVAIPAAADGPTKAPVVNTPGELDGFCSFPLFVSFPVNDETIKTFYDSAGIPVRSLVEGHLVVTISRLDPTTKAVLASMTENLSGPGQIVYNADGSQTITFLGNSGVFIMVGSQPTLLLTSGRVVVVAASPTSLGILISAVGTQTNVCTLLS